MRFVTYSLTKKEKKILIIIDILKYVVSLCIFHDILSKVLEDNWEIIRDEGLKQINNETGLFEAESENLREFGDWKQLIVYYKGR